MHKARRTAEVHLHETYSGNHYSVNLKDENGKIVLTHTMNNLNEAKSVKERWENGSYQYITES